MPAGGCRRALGLVTAFSAKLIGCGSSQPPATPPAIVATTADGGVPTGSEALEVAVVDSCGPLAPSFEADDKGARAALPGTSYESCAPVDLDGKAPCEVACTQLAVGAEPLFRTREHTIYFSAHSRRAKEIGRFLLYDGPLDSTGPRDAATRTTSAFLDATTSPPTLELRSGLCLFECNGMPRTANAKRESDCRAACPPTARHRYDKGRLRPVR